MHVYLSIDLGQVTYIRYMHIAYTYRFLDYLLHCFIDIDIKTTFWNNFVDFLSTICLLSMYKYIPQLPTYNLI